VRPFIKERVKMALVESLSKSVSGKQKLK